MSQLGLEKFMSPPKPIDWVKVEAQPLDPPANGDYYVSGSANIKIMTDGGGWQTVAGTSSAALIQGTGTNTASITVTGGGGAGGSGVPTYYPCCPCCDEESEECEGNHWAPCGEHQ